jgi:membrane protein YqaA with SNARE-associated domain
MFEFVVEWSKSLIQNYGLFGLFFVMILGSSPIPVPVEIFAITALSLGAPPYPTALFSAIGATIGGLISYYVGKGVIDFTHLREKYSREIGRAEEWLNHYGLAAVFIFALFPLPYDAMALTCGAASMRRRRFVTATFAGRIIRYLFVVRAGTEAMKFLYPYLYGFA